MALEHGKPISKEPSSRVRSIITKPGWILKAGGDAFFNSKMKPPRYRAARQIAEKTCTSRRARHRGRFDQRNVAFPSSPWREIFRSQKPDGHTPHTDRPEEFQLLHRPLLLKKAVRQHQLARTWGGCEIRNHWVRDHCCVEQRSKNCTSLRSGWTESLPDNDQINAVSNTVRPEIQERCQRYRACFPGCR